MDVGEFVGVVVVVAVAVVVVSVVGIVEVVVVVVVIVLVVVVGAIVVVVVVILKVVVGSDGFAVSSMPWPITQYRVFPVNSVLTVVHLLHGVAKPYGLNLALSLTTSKTGAAGRTFRFTQI